MDLHQFARLRSQLYHLTDKDNLPLILENRILKSTVQLVNDLKVPDGNIFLRTRRIGHRKISDGRRTISIRDQDPLFEKIVTKNLTHGMSFGDFVYLINSRVFFWAKESDMRIHYSRYEKQGELPVILRINSAELFELNKNNSPKFCRLNSGAPRCSSHYKEGAPPRGKDTFLEANQYTTGASTVREVTFEGSCILPAKLYLSPHPNKAFKLLK